MLWQDSVQRIEQFRAEVRRARAEERRRRKMASFEEEPSYFSRERTGTRRMSRRWDTWPRLMLVALHSAKVSPFALCRQVSFKRDDGSIGKRLEE